MRTQEGYQLLPTTWFPKTAGYLLRDADPLPDFNRQISKANEFSELNQNINIRVRNSIRYIFDFDNTNGSSNAATFESFKEQEQKIISEAPVILEYLATSSEVPENIRNFFMQILSGEFAVRILERFGDISDQDPNIINRFFPEGLAVFNQTVLYRYAFDFIRGIETNIQINQGEKERIKAQFTGDWEPISIQNMSENNFERVIKTVLHNAEHRLKWLNHETNTMKTLKDFQEKAEIIFGWDTEDMKFLRWTPFWDVWHTLGGAWDCVCFSRKTIFNSSSFKTA